MLKQLLCFLMVCSVLFCAKAQNSTNTRWIVCPIEKGVSMPALRKVILLDGAPQKAILEATALGVYDVTINGQPITTQELKPGWTDYRKEVAMQTLDISPYLRRGENEIRVQLSRGWWAGAISREAYGKQLPLAFRAQVIADAQVLACTDTTWEISYTGPLTEGDIYNGEAFDARRADEWKPVEQTNDFPIATVRQEGPDVCIRPRKLWRKVKQVTIYHDTIATGTTFGMIRPERTFGDKPFILHKGETAIVDFGQNMVGWVAFVAKSTAGTTLTIQTGEMLNQTGDKENRLEDGPGGSVWRYNLRTAASTITYTFSGNKKSESYRPHHTFMGFRYASLTATDDVEIRELTGQVVGSDIEEWGEFECSDASVNQLYSNIWWGQRSNFLSVPTDCPQRDERLGWTGDTQIFCRTALYQSNAANFYRKWMRDMRNSQREDGAYPDIAPWPNFWSYGTAAWGDAGVIVPWTVYHMTGDPTILYENYESMTRWMTWLAAQGDEEWKYNGAGTATGDWLAYEPLDVRYVSVAYYAYVAQIMDSIATAIGKSEDALHYRRLYKDIRHEFQQRYISKDGELSATSQTAYLLALHLGLLPEENRQAAREALRRKIENNGYRLSTGFVGTALLCSTLSEEGMNDLAYALLLQRENPSWLYSVDQGATTVWERWDSYTQEGGFHKHPWNMNSFNHYAYGAIAEWFYAYMGGIRPAAPGFRRVLLAPQADRRADNHPTLAFQPRITWIKTRIHTPQGYISSEWRYRKDGHYEYNFTLPEGVDYTIDIPELTAEDKVTVKTVRK